MEILQKSKKLRVSIKRTFDLRYQNNEKFLEKKMPAFG